MARKFNKKPLFNRRNKCEECELNINYVDYKNIEFLSRYVTATGQIKSHSQTGTCAKDQRKIARAIKRARYMALMPFKKDQIRVVKPATN